MKNSSYATLTTTPCTWGGSHSGTHMIWDPPYVRRVVVGVALQYPKDFKKPLKLPKIATKVAHSK